MMPVRHFNLNTCNGLHYTLLFILTFSFYSLKAQTISTFAGTGSSGYNGDTIQATNAEFFVPGCVTTDDSGNVYIADLLNNRIRKVNALSGIITTVAGNGSAGHSGDGGPAIAAELNEPSGVAVDTAYNIYIADYQSNRVRKVSRATGIITTIAGTGSSGYNGDGIPATNAQLAFDEDVSVDDSENVYIADTYNYRIRKITNATGIISTIAGNGTNAYGGDGGPATDAEIGHTEQLKSDASGNIYFGDEDNNRVRYVNKSTGIITTVCGNGVNGFSGEGGPATAAEISGPEGIALDASGNFYFADINDDHVMMVTLSSGIMTRVAGTGYFGFSGDGGPATDAELGAPTGVAIDNSGNIFIADQGNQRIRKIDYEATGIPLIYSSDKITVYPVPNSGRMTVQLPGNGYTSLTFFDELGRQVYYLVLDASQQNRILDLNIGNMPNGIYIMQVNSQKGVIGKRVVIDR